MKNKLEAKISYISSLLFKIAEFNVEKFLIRFTYFKRTELVSVYIWSKTSNDYLVFYIYLDSYSLDEVRRFEIKVEAFIDLLHEGNDMSELSEKLPYSSPKYVDTKNLLRSGMDNEKIY